MIELIEWEDTTHSDEPWMCTEDAEALTPANMITVGKVVVEREGSVVIAGSWGDDGELGDVNCIPLTAIKSRSQLFVVE